CNANIGLDTGWRSISFALTLVTDPVDKRRVVEPYPITTASSSIFSSVSNLIRIELLSFSSILYSKGLYPTLENSTTFTPFGTENSKRPLVPVLPIYIPDFVLIETLSKGVAFFRHRTSPVNTVFCPSAVRVSADCAQASDRLNNMKLKVIEKHTGMAMPYSVRLRLFFDLKRRNRCLKKASPLPPL